MKKVLNNFDILNDRERGKVNLQQCYSKISLHMIFLMTKLNISKDFIEDVINDRNLLVLIYQ